MDADTGSLSEQAMKIKHSSASCVQTPKAFKNPLNAWALLVIPLWLTQSSKRTSKIP